MFATCAGSILRAIKVLKTDGDIMLTRGQITSRSTSHKFFSTVCRRSRYDRWALAEARYRVLFQQRHDVRIVIRFGARQNLSRESGIYQVPFCCGMSYIGPRGRLELTRIAQHVRATENRNCRSAMTLHSRTPVIY